jgi:hypothetical protein
MKHRPSSDATIKGRLKQMHQGLGSTKPKPSSNHFAPLSTLNSPSTDEPDGDPNHKATELPPTNEL